MSTSHQTIYSGIIADLFVSHSCGLLTFHLENICTTHSCTRARSYIDEAVGSDRTRSSKTALSTTPTSPHVLIVSEVWVLLGFPDNYPVKIPSLILFDISKLEDPHTIPFSLCDRILQFAKNGWVIRQISAALAVQHRKTLPQ